MKKDNCNVIDKWIDLSGLPRYIAPGNRECVDWKNTINRTVQFMYDGYFGEATIIQYDIKTSTLYIYIDGFTEKIGSPIQTQNFSKCMFGNILRKSVAETNPDIIKYFVDINEAYKYSAQSGHIINAQCPFCGYQKKYSIATITNYNFSCPICGDGISYPNKFMFSLLKQLNINFIPEISKTTDGFEWMNNYRYDFYFKTNQDAYFIEMDGAFHYNSLFISKEESRKVDRLKDVAAAKHNINVIRIDCNYAGHNRFNYVKNSILNSGFSKLFNLSDDTVDWELCNESAISNLVKIACEHWNNGIKSSNKIAEQIGMSCNAVRNYLKTGALLGWCDYDPKNALSISVQSRNESRKKPVAIYKKNNLICICKNSNEVSAKSLEIFGILFNQRQINRICEGYKKAPNGYDVKYVSTNEFYLYINNECEVNNDDSSERYII